MEQKHPSLVWTRTSCKRQLVTLCPEPGFSGKRVLELWTILFGSVEVSEAFGCCTDSGDSGTTQQPSQASLVERSNSFWNRSSEVAAAALLCLCPETSASSHPVERAEPSEAVTDPGRRSHQHHPRRWRRGGVRNGHRTRGQSPGCGTSSRRRVMSTVCPAYLDYQKTSPSNTRTLPDFCCQMQFAHSGRHADGYGSHNLQQGSIHVWRTASLGPHCWLASCTDTPDTQDTGRWHATKIPPLSARR